MNRNIYGFPILDANEQKRTLARPIAAAAKARNEQAHTCDTCRQAERLAMVQRIVKNWK